MITLAKRPERLDTDNALGANRITSIVDPPSPDDWAVKQRRISDLKKELKALQAEVAPMNDRILKTMRQEGRSEAKFAGIVVKRKSGPSVKRRNGSTADEVMEVLTQIGHSRLISKNYSAAGVKSLILKDLEILPPELLDLFEIGESEELIVG